MKNRLLNYLNVLLFGLFLVICLSTVNGTTVFNSSDTFALMPTWEFFLLFGLSILTFVGFLLLNILYKKSYKPNMLFLIGFATLFVVGFITILIFPTDKTITFKTLIQTGEETFEFSGPEATVTYTLSSIYRWTFICQWFLLVLSTFAIFEVAPKCFDGKKLVELLCLAVFAVALFLVMYSYFTEITKYGDFLTKGLPEGNTGPYTTFSLFSVANKNSYGFILFLAIIASLFMHSQKPYWWWFIVTGFFYVNLIFNWDKSALILGFVAIIVYLLFRFFLTFKDNKKRNIIAISLIGGLFVLGLIGLLVVELTTHKIMSIISSSSHAYGRSTLMTRGWIYHKDMIIFQETSAMFGAGFKVFSHLLLTVNGADLVDTANRFIGAAHNGYFEMIGNGGFILLASFLALTAYLIYLSVKHFKEEKMISLFTMLLVSIMLLYMMIESGTYLFSQTLDYALLSVIICVPILSVHYQKNSEVTNQ